MSDGMSHGRLASAITLSVPTSLRPRSGQEVPPHSATGRTPSAVIDMAAKPPIAAGTMAAANHPSLIRPSRPQASRTTHGRPA